MKTLNQFFKLKPLLVCGRLLYSLRLSLWLPVLSFMQRNVKRPCALVFRGLHATLLASGRTKEANARLYIGYWLIFVVAPLVDVMYLVFPEKGGDKSWYYYNYFHLFLTLGPHLFLLFTLSGIFFLFPTNSRRSFALSVPIGVELAKIVCLYTATKNADIFQAVPIEITVAMTLSALVMLLTFNWLMDRQYHKLDGIKCRVDSLKAMIKSEWAVYLESEQKKLKDFQTKY